MNDLVELQIKTKPLRLLYVEDEPASREQLLMVLEILFDSITVACDGQEGCVSIWKTEKSILSW